MKCRTDEEDWSSLSSVAGHKLSINKPAPQPPQFLMQMLLSASPQYLKAFVSKCLITKLIAILGGAVTIKYIYTYMYVCVYYEGNLKLPPVKVTSSRSSDKFCKRWGVVSLNQCIQTSNLVCFISLQQTLYSSLCHTDQVSPLIGRASSPK